MAGKFRFTFGPWNIHEGADPFGPMVRQSIEFEKKLEMYKALGFDGVQFHDDDAVPDINDLSPARMVLEWYAAVRGWLYLPRAMLLLVQLNFPSRKAVLWVFVE